MAERLKFEWDPAKANANLRKHRVSFEEATTVFEDALGRIYPDETPGVHEDRFVLLGRSARELLLVVVHVERRAIIRIISARRGNRQDRRNYEEDR